MKQTMLKSIKTPVLSSGLLAAVMFVQPLLGLIFREWYRDVDWIKTAWLGNDWITLTVALPLLIVAVLLAKRGSIAGLLLWLGILGYAVYNYAYYLFGAVLNAFFPLYVSALMLSVLSLVVSLSRIDMKAAADCFRPRTPVRLLGGLLATIGIGLAAVWLLMWAAYIFAGRPTPVETEAFKIVAALDITIIAFLLVFGGILLWRRIAVGYITAAIAAILSTLYLIVLSVNSLVAILQGMTKAPGELPLWGTLAALTATAAGFLLCGVRTTGRERLEN